jgi:glucose/mannose-6-phosphate isomerase
MKDLIQDFPLHLAISLSECEPIPLEIPKLPFKNVLFCGMGGSGIGSKIVSEWVVDEIAIPMVICQNYSIPNFVNSETLVIGSSYSGDTEETLIALEACKERGAYIVGITSGGKLMDFCLNNDYPCLSVPGGFPPRAALAFSLVKQIFILESAGLIADHKRKQLLQGVDFLYSFQSELILSAMSLVDKLILGNIAIYSDVSIEGIAIRGKQQFNENSKYLCRCHVIPEMNHNELLGWGSGDQTHEVIFLRHSTMLAPNKKRMDFTRKLISEKTDHTFVIEAKGNNFIEQSIFLIHLLDWASYFLGVKRNVDVMEIERINQLKREMSKGY